jgi:hypothetical protein
MIKINENDRLAVAMVKPQDFEGGLLLVIPQLIKCDSNSLLASLEFILSSVHMSLEKIDRNLLRDIMNCAEKGTLPRKGYGHINLFKYGFLCGVIFGYYDCVTSISAVDYTETQYFNFYEMIKDS